MVATELEKIEDKKQSLASEEKTHPWRLCPAGKHFVKKHIVHTPPSTEHPSGQIIERHEHCALNPSKKDPLPAIIERFLHLYYCTTNGCSL